MKGRALILIFLFLVLVFSVDCVAAESGNGTFEQSGGSSGTWAAPGSTAAPLYANYIRFKDVGTVSGITSCGFSVAEAGWLGNTTVDSKWADATYKIGATVVGTGTYGFNKGSGKYYVIAFWNTADFTGYSGQQDIHIYSADGMDSDIRTVHRGGYDASFSDNDDIGFGTGSTPSTYWTGSVNSVVNTINYGYSFENTYEYESTVNSYSFSIDRSNTDKSKLKITNNLGNIILEEDTYMSTDDITMDSDLEGFIWTVELWNEYGDYFSRDITFSDVTAGEISFNQSFYTDPEMVEIEWDIDCYNPGSFVYEIQIVTSVCGDLSLDSWAADGNWNTSPFISSASGAAVFDFYSDGYDLPIWIQAELWAQDKNTGTWTRLDSSPVERYHEKSDIGVGSIWTEKSTYNLSEMFYIFVETDYSIIDVELISETYHDRQTLEVFEGGWQRVGYAFFSPHNFTAYLYEDGVITNQTSFSVWTTSPMMNIFLDSEALKTQFAFEFYTDNSSDTITGYKPDGSIFYGPITDLETGSREIIRGVSSSSPPGIYTISLFHDGTTYYNDTIELYSTSEWVYFDASKYETGDRIKIYSFVTDSRQQVRLTDSIGTAVITWTDSAGYIVPNSQTVLYFSLTDNNEYGMNVNTSIDTGTFRTGNWKVEIIGIDGKPLTNESTYDYTTVSKRIDSPADSSNEMVSIFFSPEGAFMLFTVCLAMMGLGIAKHPAGGGAGAVVGVGFGVYFAVLPPWMLLLMVIALVVMAGVSIAVYYKGK